MSKQFIGAKEVAELMDVAESTAYKIIRQLNKELEERGYLVITGKCPRRFFSERFYGGCPDEGEAN